MIALLNVDDIVGALCDRAAEIPNAGRARMKSAGYYPSG